MASPTPFTYRKLDNTPFTAIPAVQQLGLWETLGYNGMALWRVLDSLCSESGLISEPLQAIADRRRCHPSHVKVDLERLERELIVQLEANGIRLLIPFYDRARPEA